MERFKPYNERIEWSIDQDIKLEDFLKKIDFSLNLCKKAYRENQFYVDGKLVNRNICLKKGTILSYIISNEKTSYQEDKTPLNIIFEDEHFLIINKPPYLSMMPVKGAENGALINQVAYHFRLYGIQRKVRFVNRLDRDTSGIIVIAKHAYAQSFLMKQMEKRLVEKNYIALIHGNLTRKSGSIDLSLERKKGNIRTEITSEGKKAVTEYCVLEEQEDYSLVHIELKTGRTHQIRAHFSAIGHPLVGDKTYGSTSSFPRQCLHSYRYQFKNVDQQERQFKAGLPDDMKDLLRLLRFQFEL